MDITWFFGNGLDIGLGLNTRYLDFFAYLEKKNIINNIVFDIYKNDKNNGKIRLWSNYEIRLGEITEQIEIEQIQKFCVDKEEIDNYLEEYLLEENKKLELKENTYQELLKNGIRSLSHLYREIDNLKIKSMVNSHLKEIYTINAISFNYTDSVNKMFNVDDSAMSAMRIHSRPLVSYQLVIGEVLYIHGTITNKEMIVGLGDESQIKNLNIANSKTIKNLLIKKNLLKLAGQLKREALIKIIEKSDIICLYGTSLGITDNDYWIMIKQTMIRRNAILLYYYFDDDISSKMIFSKNVKIEEVKERFYELSHATDKEKAILDNLIIIEFNNYIFAIDNVKK